jgi:hemoglobin
MTGSPVDQLGKSGLHRSGSSPCRFSGELPSLGAVTNTAPSLFSRVGGLPFFERLVDAFYEGVATDEVLLPLYPEQPDLTGARHRLTLFLAQYWGGPATYNEERGHPRLRMRHFPFRIGAVERDHWLAHMGAAVKTVCAADDIPDDVAEELIGYFVTAAEHLRNDTGLPITPSTYPR